MGYSALPPPPGQIPVYAHVVIVSCMYIIVKISNSEFYLIIQFFWQVSNYILVWHVLSNYPSTTSPPRPPNGSNKEGLAVNLSVGQVNPDKGNISRIYQHSSKTYLSNNIQETFKEARVYIRDKRVGEINWNLCYAIFSTAGSIVYTTNQQISVFWDLNPLDTKYKIFKNRLYSYILSFMLKIGVFL